jgi:putative DNA primase/helicase
VKLAELLNVPLARDAKARKSRRVQPSKQGSDKSAFDPTGLVTAELAAAFGDRTGHHFTADTWAAFAWQNGTYTDKRGHRHSALALPTQNGWKIVLRDKKEAGRQYANRTIGGHDLIRVDSNSDSTVILCEGQWDAMILLETGWSSVATSTGGAGTWRDEWTATFSNRKVAIAYDADESGQLGAKKVAESMQRHGVTHAVLELPLSGDPEADGKDWEDLLRPRDESLRLVETLLGAAEWIEPSPSAARNHSTLQPHEFNLTDAGNAERMAASYGDRLRFDHRRQRWLIYEGHRWQEDAMAKVYRAAKESARALYHDAPHCGDQNRRENVSKHALRSESRNKIEAALTLAKSEPPIADDGESWDLDPFLLGVENGVVDLRTGELRRGQREDGITMAVPIPFDPMAERVRWERFVLEVLNGDAELYSFVQRAVGYSLTGDTREQCLFLCHGTGRNGKSTFLRVLQEIAGDYGANTPFSTLEYHQRSAIPSDVAALVGKRLVTSSETTATCRLNESRIKALTGGDPMTARFLHQDYFTFDPQAKFWLAVNHRPRVYDDSYAFWRRVHLIPFEVQFTDETDQRDLREELRSKYQGVLAWAVEGAVLWQSEGLEPPESVRVATEAYRAENDVLSDFINDCLELDSAGKAPAGATFKAYQSWAEDQGMKAKELLGSRTFGSLMKERFGYHRDAHGRWYLGAQLRRKEE